MTRKCELGDTFCCVIHRRGQTNGVFHGTSKAFGHVSESRRVLIAKHMLRQYNIHEADLRVFF